MFSEVNVDSAESGTYSSIVLLLRVRNEGKSKSIISGNTLQFGERQILYCLSKDLKPGYLLMLRINCRYLITLIA